MLGDLLDEGNVDFIKGRITERKECVRVARLKVYHQKSVVAFVEKHNFPEFFDDVHRQLLGQLEMEYEEAIVMLDMVNDILDRVGD